MPRRLIPALPVVLVFVVTIAPAQMRGGLGRAAHSSRAYGASHHGGSYYNHRRSDYARGYYLGDTPFFYDDYPFEPAIPEAPPQAMVMQAPADAPPSAKAAPLLIELQGDRYVRYGGVEQSSTREAFAGSAPAAHDSVERASPQPSTSAQLAPTVLIYRDGHREEVPDYAIIGRVLYAHNNDDGHAGYGLRNIELSALDLPATMKANRENGVGFVLPSGPNEVITRP